MDLGTCAPSSHYVPFPIDSGKGEGVMKGWAYEVSDYYRMSPRPKPSYEAVRRARPQVVKNLLIAFRINDNTRHKCIVYAAINKTNNKIYIGKTVMGLARRKIGHLVASNQDRKSLFCSAIKKYGIDGFHWIVLQKCRDEEHAYEREKYAVAAILPEYNMSEGGIGGAAGKIVQTTEWEPSPEAIDIALKEQRELAKKNNVSKIEPKWSHSQESKERRSAAKKKWWDDKRKNEEEFSAFLADMRISRRKPEFHKKAKRVMCITDNNKVFPSIASAATFYNISKPTVARSCKKNGAYKYPRNHRFVYVDSIKK